MKKHASPGGSKPIALNRRARFDYEISETFEAGLLLEGPEVKSAKSGGFNLSGSYIVFHQGRPQLLGARIAPYPYSRLGPDPERTRELLLHSRENDYLRGRIEEAGYTLLPLRAYLKRGLVKLELGLGRGKKTRDKRDQIRRRELDREALRSLQDRARRA